MTRIYYFIKSFLYPYILWINSQTLNRILFKIEWFIGDKIYVGKGGYRTLGEAMDAPKRHGTFIILRDK